MIRRHPHVFGDEKVSDSKHVLENWSEIKAKEKALKPAKAAKGFDIPVALPALARAHKIGDKTQKQKFDWPNAEEVFKKVHEEIGELTAEMKRSPLSPAALEHELGDVLFSVAQLARHLGFEAEQCLRVANARFESRYFQMREAVEKSGRDWTKLGDEEKELAWAEVKKRETAKP
jgi:MazG family protein